MRLMQSVSCIKPSVDRKWILSYIYCIQIFLRFIGLLGGYKMLNLSNQEKGGKFQINVRIFRSLIIGNTYFVNIFVFDSRKIRF